MPDLELAVPVLAHVVMYASSSTGRGISYPPLRVDVVADEHLKVCVSLRSTWLRLR